MGKTQKKKSLAVKLSIFMSIAVSLLFILMIAVICRTLKAQVLTTTYDMSQNIVDGRAADYV